jgi:hypothetical protein
MPAVACGKQDRFEQGGVGWELGAAGMPKPLEVTTAGGFSPRMSGIGGSAEHMTSTRFAVTGQV